MDMDKDGVVDAAGTDEERSSPIQSHAETMANVIESNASVTGGRGKRGGRGGASQRRTAISAVKADDDVVMAVDTTIGKRGHTIGLIVPLALLLLSLVQLTYAVEMRCICCI